MRHPASALCSVHHLAVPTRGAAVVALYAVLVFLQAAPLGVMVASGAREVSSSHDAETAPSDEPALSEGSTDPAHRRSQRQSYALCALATPGASAQGIAALCGACQGRAVRHNGRGIHLQR